MCTRQGSMAQYAHVSQIKIKVKTDAKTCNKIKTPNPKTMKPSKIIPRPKNKASKMLFK